MARTRYQHPKAILRKGKRVSAWYGTYREDVLENGTVTRVLRKLKLGTLEDYPTQKLAQRALDEKLAEINDPMYAARPTVTVKQFAKTWIEIVLPQHKLSGQSSDRARIEQRIVPALGNVKLKDLNGMIVQQFVTGLSTAARADKRKGPLSPKTVKNVYKLLRSMWKTAKAWGYVTTNPFELVKLPEMRPAEQRCFTPEESGRIIEAAPEPFNLLFYVLAQTGVRIGEALGLHVDDIKNLGGTWVVEVKRSVWRSKEQTPKSARSVRKFPITPKLGEDLKAYIKASGHTKLVFCTKEGNPYDQSNLRQQVWVPLLRKLKIPHGGFHAFRHGMVTKLGQEGMSPAVIQAKAGHVDFGTTMGYMHAVSEDQKRAAQLMDDALFATRRVQ